MKKEIIELADAIMSYRTPNGSDLFSWQGRLLKSLLHIACYDEKQVEVRKELLRNLKEDFQSCVKGAL